MATAIYTLSIYMHSSTLEKEKMKERQKDGQTERYLERERVGERERWREMERDGESQTAREESEQ